MNAKIDEIADAIAQELQSYSDAVTQEVKNKVDVVTKEVNEEIKNHITFNQPTGKYVKAFKTKTTYEDEYKKVNTWYVGNGQARLTHLLENGHALRNGGRAREFPHIKFGDTLAQKRMEELAREAAQNAGH